jgi:hypothetical protein
MDYLSPNFRDRRMRAPRGFRPSSPFLDDVQAGGARQRCDTATLLTPVIAELRADDGLGRDNFNLGEDSAPRPACRRGDILPRRKAMQPL